MASPVPKGGCPPAVLWSRCLHLSLQGMCCGGPTGAHNPALLSQEALGEEPFKHVHNKVCLIRKNIYREIIIKLYWGASKLKYQYSSLRVLLDFLTAHRDLGVCAVSLIFISAFCSLQIPLVLLKNMLKNKYTIQICIYLTILSMIYMCVFYLHSSMVHWSLYFFRYLGSHIIKANGGFIQKKKKYIPRVIFQVFGKTQKEGKWFGS